MTTVIVFSHLRWGHVYQRPQHLMSRLASYYRILFIEEPLRTNGTARFDRQPQGPFVDVLCPFTAVDAPGFHDDQLAVLKPLLDDYLRDHGIDDYVVWYYTPLPLPLMSHLHPRAVVYDCMDELSAFKNAPRQIRQRETALLKTADLVFTGGPSLYEVKRHLHPAVHCLPSAVDAPHFSPALLDPNSTAAHEARRLMAAIGRPRLGFCGVIDERFDADLLARIAAERPRWQFVMVGPVVKIDPASLPRRENIHWLGMQSYGCLPYLLAEWDVCLMPFARNESTRFISPAKTLEYLAAERPVVSTAIPDVIGLYGDVVRIAHDAADFVAACADAMNETPAQRQRQVSAMRGVVSRFSWDASAQVVHRFIEAELGKLTVARTALRALGGLEQRGEASDGSIAAPFSATVGAHGTIAPRSFRHLVVGAGPIGLAAAYHLTIDQLAADVLVVEREERIGGSCRSQAHEGFIFDHSGHLMGDAAPGSRALYDRLLGDNQHWQPLNTARYRTDADPGAAPPAPSPRGPSAQLRQADPTGLETAPLDARFGYPLRGGLQALIDGFARQLLCELALKTSVVHLSPAQRTIRLDDGRTLRYDSLISTVPVSRLIRACGNEVPADVRAAAEALRQVSLRCVHLGVGRPRLSDKHWIYYPDDIVFQRVFMQGNASPFCSPPGGFGLTCEIPYCPAQPLPCEGRALIDRVLADCRRVKLIAPDDEVLVSKQIDIPYAYVAYDERCAARLARIREWLADGGVIVAGECSEAEYQRLDHALIAGRAAAEMATSLTTQRAGTLRVAS